MAVSTIPSFTLFSTVHFVSLGTLLLLIISVFIFRKDCGIQPKQRRLFERFFALSLVIMEILYHVWMINTGRWNLSNSLPLELCSISLVFTILLLWTGNRKLIDFVFFAGIGGALQAVITPVLDVGFPHFRYLHFFYTHTGIILTTFYFLWMKEYRPTFKGVIKTMVFLNVLLPLVVGMNLLVDGNYMFLKNKPGSNSLLDFLGPHPWYILSLEGIAFSMFIVLWLLFRGSQRTHNA
ncbi:TIGR02206 family membrane protein [Sporosarcina siberiensis]|uniref:TIGR02206 family membrane protein n=1 Tax=Sporosarcina siberiensis TaxID=1365606 RepID=A0ABW4SFF4_9BACL